MNGGPSPASASAPASAAAEQRWKQQQQALADGPAFSETLHSLASTLPPPMVISSNAVLGSVGGGLHFQRTYARRKPLDAVDPNFQECSQ